MIVIKKFILSSLILTLTIAGSSSIASAKTTTQINSYTPQVYDTEKIPSKEFTPYRVDSSTNSQSIEPYATVMHWVAKSSWYATDAGAHTISDSYKDDSKTTKVAIDRIMAKARLYFNNTLDSSAIDDNQYSSHSGAYTRCTSYMHIIGDHEVYGSHAFEKAGYSSWYPETYDT